MVEDEITPQLYAKWRAPRRGSSHAQRLNNPVWNWLIRERLSAYAANEAFAGPSSLDAGPAWCFQRMGQSQTALPDGRTVYFAGEHEDHYDPDFYIYNDVVLVAADGSIDIFGYPAADVPPTDFHTASPMGSTIVLVGNLGYPEDRVVGATQVLALDVESKRVSTIRSSGDVPGWISSHSAELVGTAVVIRGGTFFEEEDCENIDEWRLDTDRWVWTRLTDRRWTTIRFSRADGSPHRLFDIEQFAFYSGLSKDSDFKRQGLSSCRESLAEPPDLDLFRRRYLPSLEHDVVASNAAHAGDENDQGEFGVHRISVQGVVVRFNERTLDISMTVEGTLPADTIDALAGELQGKLGALERTPYDATPVKRR